MYWRIHVLHTSQQNSITQTQKISVSSSIQCNTKNDAHIHIFFLMIFLHGISSTIIIYEGCKLKCCMYIVCMMIKDKKENRI